MIKKFSIGGMSCSACSSGIERNVKKLDGINSVSVSLLAKEMQVDFNESIISTEKIIAVVQKLGYTAELFGTKKRDKFSDAKKLRNRFFISLAVLIPLMYFAMGKMISLPTFNDDRINFSICFILALTILILNRKFFISGTRAVIHRSPNMDTLVSLGAASAFIYSTVMTVTLFLGTAKPMHTFFDGSAMVVTLVTLGKWLEELSKIRTGDAVEKLGTLIPKAVTVLKDGKEETVLTSELSICDVVVLKAGDYVAVDGVVVSGNANVDKSAITGESMPEEVTEGSLINSGSILKDGYLLVRAEKVGAQTLFSKIVEIVRTAGASKAPIQKFADKVSGVFVPIVTTIAIITFIVWLIVTSDLYRAFNFGISVLVVSCPCALGLATPVAVMAATGNAASKGILFKDAEALQKMCKIDCILLDKTATITVGKPKVTDYRSFESYLDKKEIFATVSALESKSRHPLAQCVIDFCGASCLDVDNYEYITGKGMTGEVYGVKYYLGNKDLIPENVKGNVDENDFYGKTVIYFASEDELIAEFAIADYVKEDSKSAIIALQSQGIKTVMITGDNYGAAERIAQEVNISEFKAEVLPQDKYAIVESYKKDGYFTAMVGDGINDSPALKSADVGVAMGTGTDIAIDSSDVVIANGSLTALSNAVDISKKSLKIIKQNLFWAFFYNAIGIPVAAGVFAFINFTLTPAIASAMMCISSLFVVTNALRIAGKKNKKNRQEKCDGESCSISVKTVVAVVDGMMCNHCAGKVKDALTAIKGVYSVDVNLKEKTVTIVLEQTVTDDLLFNAIEHVGYKVLKIN